MKRAVDSSVLVAALDEADPDHKRCRKLLLGARPFAARETRKSFTRERNREWTGAGVPCCDG